MALTALGGKTMINWIWLALFLTAFLVAGASGRLEATTQALFRSAEQTVMFCIGLVGILSFWSGMMRIADEAGLTRTLARIARPVLSRLFPTLPKDGKALGAVALSLAANVLGIGNAATPLGLRAMEELEKANDRPGRVSPAMGTFLSLIMGGFTLIPSTVIAFRARAGSTNPAGIILPIILATLCGTVTALVMNRLLESGGKE